MELCRRVSDSVFIGDPDGPFAESLERAPVRPSSRAVMDVCLHPTDVIVPLSLLVGPAR